MSQTAPGDVEWHDRSWTSFCGPTLEMFNTLKDRYQESILATGHTDTAITTIWVGPNSYTIVVTSHDKRISCAINMGTDFQVVGVES